MVSYALRGRQQVCSWHLCAFVSLPAADFTDAKAMEKRISTQSHCFVSVVGPAGSAKTRLFGRMIGNQEKTFSPSFDKIIYVYKHYQQHYDAISMDCEFTHVDIEFVHAIEWNYLQITEAQKKKRILLVLEDLFDEAAQGKEFLALVVAKKHRNVHLMVPRHNFIKQKIREQLI